MACAAVSDGIAARISQAVISDIQVKTGSRNQPIPGARRVTTVTSKFTPVAMVPMLVTSRPSAQ